MQDVFAYPDGVLALRVDRSAAGPMAVHIVIHRGEALIVDTATNASVPFILSALVAAGIAPEAVRWVVLTHLHLDHASGAGSLMCALPNAKVVVHQAAVEYIQQPALGWHGNANQHYSDQLFNRYGHLVPITPQCIVPVADRDCLTLGERNFHVVEVPGHTAHHICLWDDSARAFFTGDAFGTSYRALDVRGRASILPSITPSQFDPDALHASIERLLSFAPEAMYLSHFGRVTDVTRLAQDLHRLIDAQLAVAHAARGDDGGRHDDMIAGLEQLILDEAERQGWTLSGEEVLQYLQADIQKSACGLARWLDQRNQPSLI